MFDAPPKVGHAVSEGDLVVGRFTIPGRELAWEFGTSGGPGGQHANKASTRAELSWAIDESDALPPDVKQRVSQALSGRITQGVLTVTSDDSRSQWRNRSIARKRMAELIEEAARPPKTRRPTKPSRSARRRRLDAKRRRSETKQLRAKIDPSD
jgi:ribosome-associated protein